MDPWVKNPQAALCPGPYAEGERVRFIWGVTPVEGVIIEDRGNLGVGGGRLYRIEADMGPDSPPLVLTLPAEDLTRVADADGETSKGQKRKAGRRENGPG
jgi:hypothetical protein